MQARGGPRRLAKSHVGAQLCCASADKAIQMLAPLAHPPKERRRREAGQSVRQPRFGGYKKPGMGNGALRAAAPW